jgi:hypothetical protein
MGLLQSALSSPLIDIEKKSLFFNAAFLSFSFYHSLYA